MAFFNLPLVFREILSRFGFVWLLVAIGILAAVSFAKSYRAFGVGIVVLMSMQIWWEAPHVIAHLLRWTVIAILLVRACLVIVRGTSPPGERHMSHIVLGLLCGWAVLSCAWSEERTYSLAVAATFLAGTVMSYGLVWRLSDRVDLLAVLGRWAVVGSFVAFGSGLVLYAYAEAVRDLELLFWTMSPSGRYQGLFTNPNSAGVLGALFLPGVLASPGVRLGRARPLRIPAVVLLLVTIYLSGSRSAAIGSLLAIAVLGLYRFRVGAVFSSVSLVAIVTLLVVATPAETLESDATVQHVVRSESLPTLSGRREIWEMGWDVGMESPIIGSGWGASRVLDRRDVSSALEIGKVRSGTNLHNAHLQLFVDTGIIGVALFWVFLAQLGWACVRILRAPRSPDQQLRVMIIAAVVVMIGDSMVHGWHFSMGGATALLFWLFCGIVLKEAEKLRLGQRASAAAARRPRVSEAAAPRPHGFPA